VFENRMLRRTFGCKEGRKCREAVECYIMRSHLQIKEDKLTGMKEMGNTYKF
jgi:hypothetical protein